MLSGEGSVVLRIPRADDPATFVLVHVSRSGKDTLDLRLVATEGENPYVGAVKWSHLRNLRSKSYQGSDNEFEEILTSVFGQRSFNVPAGAAVHTGLETGASIRGSEGGAQEVVITVRKRIDSITQRVASVILTQDDNQTIELFEWTSLMISRADTLDQQIYVLTDRLQAAEDTINKLNFQLEELVQTKNEHENHLMMSFVQVLNEKKLKIRNQQRLLASAKVDTGRVFDLRAGNAGRGQHRRTGTSRSTKRKVEDDVLEASDTENEFERMDIDQAKSKLEDEDEASELMGRETPQPLEDETLMETEDEDEDAVLISPSRNDGKDGKRSQRAKSKSDHLTLARPASPPPQRDLPFPRISTRRMPSAREKDNSAESLERPYETGGETDDDEL